MKKALKVIGITIAAIIGTILLWAIIIFTIILPPKPSVEAMQRFYVSNRENLLIVQEFMLPFEYENVTISNTDENYHSVRIYDNNQSWSQRYDDEAVYKAMIALFKSDKCHIISKYRYYISFQCWDTRSDASGIVYSIDGNPPNIHPEYPPSSKEVIVEPLGYDGWYYYSFHYIYGAGN
jgi:hypothetical protein